MPGAATRRTDDHPESATAGSGQPTPEPILGGNLNGRPRRLLDNLALLDVSKTRWIRAFLDIRRLVAAGRDPATDPDVRALRRAARDRGCRLVVSLKWDFKGNWGDKSPIAVPPSGSKRERTLLRWAGKTLDAIDTPIDVVVLGNEPMWETREDDVSGPDPAIIEFTRAVKNHLRREADIGSPLYLLGALNRTHESRVREGRFGEFHRELFDFAREDGDIDGVDLHIHYHRIREAEATLEYVRGELPDGVVTATEFSPVWRYFRHKDRPIGDSDSGRRFADEYDLPTAMTPVEYFERAKRDRRRPTEMADFYAAMPWYNVDHITDMYRLFADFDVHLGSIGFMQGLGMRDEDWSSDWLPFHINAVFQPALIQPEDGLESAANRHYLADYRAYAATS